LRGGAHLTVIEKPVRAKNHPTEHRSEVSVSFIRKEEPLATRRLLLALLSGTMLTASFPPGNYSWLIWIALVPLLQAIQDQTFTKALRIGFVAGLAHYLTLLYWIIAVLGHYGNMDYLVSLGPLLLLCLYLSCYLALFCAATNYTGNPIFISLQTAALWVIFEFMRAKLLSGFPWCLLGYTQFKNLPLIQISAYTGVYGVSFLIVLCNVLLHRVFFRSHLGSRLSLGIEISTAVCVMLGAYAYGHHRFMSGEKETLNARNISVAIIQANIDQSVKWDPSFQETTMGLYKRLTKKALVGEPELIVWPETSIPFFFQERDRLASEIISLLHESKASLIFGSPAYEHTKEKTIYYNRAYLLETQQTSLQYYDKIHLVPFGEYVPFKEILSFVNRLVPAAGDFAAGNRFSPLRLESLLVGVTICFEAIFPELSRIQTRQGAQILVNLTNDAWFGMSSAPHQHLSMAVFRSVENNRSLIRAANTGISALVNPYGKIVDSSPLFEVAVLEGRVPVSEAPPTFYTNYGDLFIYLLMVVCIVRFLVVYWNKRRIREDMKPI
jgi:apolipoprotein N-acyltransferase